MSDKPFSALEEELAEGPVAHARDFDRQVDEVGGARFQMAGDGARHLGAVGGCARRGALVGLAEADGREGRRAGRASIMPAISRARRPMPDVSSGARVEVCSRLPD
ncbi:hypothetical protein ABZZ36_41175 [Actinacidiphila glaucinigra]